MTVLTEVTYSVNQLKALREANIAFADSIDRGLTTGSSIAQILYDSPLGGYLAATLLSIGRFKKYTSLTGLAIAMAGHVRYLSQNDRKLHSKELRGGARVLEQMYKGLERRGHISIRAQVGINTYHDTNYVRGNHDEKKNGNGIDYIILAELTRNGGWILAQ